MAEVSPLLQAGVAFSFGYGFIRALSTYEATRHTKSVHELVRAAEGIFSKEPAKLERIKELETYFSFGILRSQKEFNRLASVIMTLNFVLGVVGMLMMTFLAFDAGLGGNRYFLSLSVLILFFPMLSAIVLWVASRFYFREAIRHRKLIESSVCL